MRSPAISGSTISKPTAWFPRRTSPPSLAVISIDGGRYQTRSEGQGPGAHDPAWREDKVADLVTMSTQSHDEIPTPNCLNASPRRKQVVELVQGITSQGALADVIDPGAEVRTTDRLRAG